MASPERSELRRVRTVRIKRPSNFVELARLLRRLDDPESVRRNPLVAGAFGRPRAGRAAVDGNVTLLRIRAAVLSAVATLDTHVNARNVHFARQRTIVTRCDLRGEKHAAVAADLGVSLREFYRERRRAFERLLANLESNLRETQQPVRALPTRFELDLDRVANFRLVGAFGAAFALLERIASEAADPSDGVRALCYGVEIASDIGDNECARRLFRASAPARSSNGGRFGAHWRGQSRDGMRVRGLERGQRLGRRERAPRAGCRGCKAIVTDDRTGSG